MKRLNLSLIAATAADLAPAAPATATDSSVIALPRGLSNRTSGSNHHARRACTPSGGKWHAKRAPGPTLGRRRGEVRGGPRNPRIVPRRGRLSNQRNRNRTPSAVAESS